MRRLKRQAVSDKDPNAEKLTNFEKLFSDRLLRKNKVRTILYLDRYKEGPHQGQIESIGFGYRGKNNVSTGMATRCADGTFLFSHKPFNGFKVYEDLALRNKADSVYTPQSEDFEEVNTFLKSMRTSEAYKERSQSECSQKNLSSEVSAQIDNNALPADHKLISYFYNRCIDNLQSKIDIHDMSLGLPYIEYNVDANTNLKDLIKDLKSLRDNRVVTLKEYEKNQNFRYSGLKPREFVPIQSAESTTERTESSQSIQQLTALATSATATTKRRSNTKPKKEKNNRRNNQIGFFV